MKREAEEKRNKDDFVGESNLGDLDLDSFLKSVADDGGDQEDDESMGDDNESDSESDSTSEEQEQESSKAGLGSGSGSDDEEEDVEAAEKRMKEEMQKLA